MTQESKEYMQMVIEELERIEFNFEDYTNITSFEHIAYIIGKSLNGITDLRERLQGSLEMEDL